MDKKKINEFRDWLFKEYKIASIDKKNKINLNYSYRWSKDEKYKDCISDYPLITHDDEKIIENKAKELFGDDYSLHSDVIIDGCPDTNYFASISKAEMQGNIVYI